MHNYAFHAFKLNAAPTIIAQGSYHALIPENPPDPKHSPRKSNLLLVDWIEIVVYLLSLVDSPLPECDQTDIATGFEGGNENGEDMHVDGALTIFTTTKRAVIINLSTNIVVTMKAERTFNIVTIQNLDDRVGPDHLVRRCRHLQFGHRSCLRRVEAIGGSS
ncbi:hypothetical protein BLNAU_7183 [Blattamonas nauphoetae]|uniref:Uncharacterized protein n=1 Tax=Blattamonas nauphoetae TaxID=2049346 RepID=A0ABQ9Y1Y6_9EUKA|nr:hypothetical protein BLNAU_7183 [Blattamonas nauphoetae]